MPAFSIVPDVKKTQCLIVPVFEEKGLSAHAKTLDAVFDGVLSRVYEAKDFEGKKLQMSFGYTAQKDLRRVLLIGLGKQKDFSMRVWKEAVGAGIIAAQGKKAARTALVVPAQVVKSFGPKLAGQETVTAAEIAQYAFDEYKKKEDRVTRIDEVLLVSDAPAGDMRQMQKGIDEGRIIAECVNASRDLGNTPPGIMTPTLLAKRAQELAKGVANLKATVFTKTEIQKHKMGCLLGVSQGSVEEPRFIILEYRGAGKNQKPTVLVGKGITFDSGGLSLKPENYMKDMKFDMLGGAAVIGATLAAAKLKLKKNVVALVPACENMPSGSSYRPDDILIAMNGRSVHIGNTDAEGRVILADALCYAAKYQPKEVIDFATLTGACMVALGLERSGLFTEDETLAARIDGSAQKVGEQLWRLPLGDEYRESMKSDVADITNMGKDRYGGASQGAVFLEFFTKDTKTGEALYPWAHVDMASAIYGGTGKPWIRPGANGFGVQGMVEYLR